MKKTLLALTTAAFLAGSAQAATIYNTKDTTLDLDGSVRVVLQNHKGETTDLKDDDSRVGLKVTQKVSNGLSAFAGTEFRFNLDNDADANGQKEDSVYVKSLYAGLKFDSVGSLSFGRQANLVDMASKSNVGYRFEKVIGDLGFADYSKKSVKFVSDEFAGFRFGADYGFGSNTDKDAEVRDRTVSAGLFYNTKVSDVDLGASAVYYSDRTADVTNGATVKVDTKGYLVGVQAKYDGFTFGVDHGNSKLKADGVQVSKHTATQFGVAYEFTPQVTAFGAFKLLKHDDTEGRGYLLGADYKLTQNVVTYLQYNEAKYDGEARDHVTSLGLRVLF